MRQTEADFMRTVLEYASLRGWKFVHFRAGLNRRGRWQTPISGEPGFPDVVCVRGDRVVALELKRQGGKATPAQLEWLLALDAVQGITARVVRPSDWAWIEEMLR